MHPVTNVVPLSLVLFVSLVKEAFEDWVSMVATNYMQSWCQYSLSLSLSLSRCLLFSMFPRSNLILFVFFFICIKQKRFQNDMTINNNSVDVLQDQKWESIPWKRLQVGDIVRVSVLLLIMSFMKFIWFSIWRLLLSCKVVDLGCSR